MTVMEAGTTETVIPTVIPTVLQMKRLPQLPAGERAAEFYERRGRTVFQGAGSWWASIDVGSRSYLNCCDHLVLGAKPEEVSAALGRQGAIAAQYASQDPGCASGVYWLDDVDYDMNRAQKRMRNFIRRGINAFEIRSVAKDELQDRGIAINIETMSRHETFREEFSNPAQWRRNVEAIYGMDGVVCTGAFEDGVLMGYLFGIVDDGVLFLMVQKTVDAALEKHANPALMFETCRAAFATGQVRAISLGTVPFLNSPNLHQFKTRMGFAVQPYNMRIQLHPALEVFAAPGLTGLAARWASKIPVLGGRIERQAKLLQLGKGYVVPEAVAREVKEESVDAGN